ncbi:MAG: OmpA family protein [Magnetococcus sp. MYC-9]
MKNLKIALLAGAALLFATTPLQLEAAAPGQWSNSGFTQWHPNDGKTPLGYVGTQCYFCKPDAPAPAPAAPAVAKAPGDEDGDGVLDPDDKCPGTPKGAPVNKQGCWVIKNLTFKTNSAKIETKDMSGLKETASVLKKNPNIGVEIQGHTDNVGSAAYNKKLSNQRAHSVMSSLVKEGINKRRMTARGYGLEKPVASNATVEGRAENRRVELNVTSRTMDAAKAKAPAKKKVAKKKAVKKDAAKKAAVKKAPAKKDAAKPDAVKK